jgi:hypothetical protein
VRQAVRAVWVGAESSLALALLSALLGTAVLLVPFALVVKSRGERAALLEARFLSEGVQEHQEAVNDILRWPLVDGDRLADAYFGLRPSDPRRARIEKSYFLVTGELMEIALRRLGHLLDEPPPNTDLRPGQPARRPDAPPPELPPLSPPRPAPSPQPPDVPPPAHKMPSGPGIS